MKELIFCIIYLVVQVITAVVGTIMGLEIMMIMLVTNGILVLVMLWMFKPVIAEALEDYRGHLGKYVAITLLGELLILGGTLAFTQIFGEVSPENQELLQQAMGDVPPAVFFTAIVVVIPIIEEFIYRYILIGALSKKTGILVATLISMALFVFIHVGINFSDAVPYLSMTIVFTGAFLLSGKNFLVSLGIHMLNNLLAAMAMMSMST